MSSIFETLDFANDFFGQPDRNKQKISRREYISQDVDYYRQGLDSTGIKVSDPERWSDIDEDNEDRKRDIDISQVGVSEGNNESTPSIGNLSSGVDNALSSSSSLSNINASFVDYNTSLQNAGFKDRSKSFLSKNFGISLASIPQSGKEARTDIVGTFTTEKGREALAVSAAKKGLGFLGVNPIATSLLSGFVTGTTLQDPLGNPSYRPNHAVLGTVMDINFSIQSNNIAQSIAAMNANLDVPYSQRGAVGYFGYDPTNGQLISRAPLGMTWTGTTNLSIEQLSNLEALSKGFTTRGYNNQTERGERLAMSTDTVGGQVFGGYSNNGFHHGINGSSRTGTMAQAEKAAKGYGITTKQFTDILSKVRKNNTFFGKPKNDKLTVDYLSRKQFRDNESKGGSYSMGLETDVTTQQSIQDVLSGKTPPSLSPSVGTSVSTSQGAVGSTGGLGGGYGFGENDDGGGGPDSSASTSGVGDSTRYGGKIGNGFALGGRGDAEPAGFIEGPPEQFSDQTTIADDIPLKVKDGTFVINAPAVEYAGSMDIQKMLAEGYEKALTRDIGVDKNFRIGKIPSKEELDIQISRGEVVVPPHVAKAIGYDRLEKINNRGKREVARRQQKAGDQEKVQAGQGFAANGGKQKITIFRGEPYPEQIGEFDRKYMSGRRMTGAWFSSNKNYAKNYGDLQKTLDVTFDEYAKGAKKAEMYRNIASMQSESGSRQLTKDQKKKLFKHVKEIKQFAKMVKDGKVNPNRFVNTLHMSVFPDKKDEATIKKIESYKNNPKLFAKLVVRGLANNIVTKGVPFATKVIPGLSLLSGFAPKEMGDATLSGKEGFIYDMTDVRDGVMSFAEGGFATGNGVFTIDKVADSYREKYATAPLARQATMKLAKKMPLADALAILIWGEAKNLGDEGLEGAAHVLINRANAEKYPGFGKSIYEELTRTYKGAKGERIFEFNALEPTKFRETIKKFKKDKDTYLRVRNIAEEVMAGARKDFTNNALFFYNPFTSGSDWYKEQVSKKQFKETYRTVNPKNKKVLHVYHVPSDFKMDTILGTEKITPEQFKPSTSIPNEIPLPMKRPKEVEDRSDDGGGFIDYLRKLF